MKRKRELPTKEIVEKWNNGRSYSKLAEEYEVSRMTIRNRINEYYHQIGGTKPDRKIANMIETGRKKLKLPTEEIVEKWNDGIGIKKLAKEYEVDKSTILSRINEYYQQRGEEKPDRGEKNKIEVERKKLLTKEIVEKWKNGISTKQLAKDYGINRRTIYERIDEYYRENKEEKPDKRRDRKEIPIEEMIQKWNEGIKQQQLAKEYGISITTIRNRINEYYKEKRKAIPKNKILKNKDILIEYLEKGLSEQQIKDIAKSKKITIPDNIMNQANKEVRHKKTDIER